MRSGTGKDIITVLNAGILRETPAVSKSLIQAVSKIDIIKHISIKNVKTITGSNFSYIRDSDSVKIIHHTIKPIDIRGIKILTKKKSNIVISHLHTGNTLKFFSVRFSITLFFFIVYLYTSIVRLWTNIPSRNTGQSTISHNLSSTMSNNAVVRHRHSFKIERNINRDNSMYLCIPLGKKATYKARYTRFVGVILNLTQRPINRKIFAELTIKESKSSFTIFKRYPTHICP